MTAIKVPLYFRKRNIIITAIDGEATGGAVEHLKSVNEAKRKSVLLQKANGGLGRGSVSVIR